MILKLFSLLFVLLCIDGAQAVVANALETCTEEKDFKVMLKTRPNLLILFSKTDTDVRDLIKLMKEVNVAIKGSATIAYINCEKAKKICKKYKINPNPYELKHYNEGAFNKDYDRQLVKKSIITFLRDPTGELPWEEEESSKDVIHFNSEASFNKVVKKAKVGVLVMFYAPWCGHCKKMKPDYSAAATALKKKAILAAANCDLAENNVLRRTYNITGYPTVLYFKNGTVEFPYGGEYTETSIIEWMNNPTPPKPKEKEVSWAEEEDVHATFLTDDNFDGFIESHANVLVAFYAPWCGHCKTIKPIYNNVAKKLKEEGSENIIAFVDATEQTNLAQRFKVKGFPTIKFFKDGKVAWDYSERDEQKVLEFMRNPSEPPVKTQELQWKDEQSYVIHAEGSNFAPILKTKKHALVIFYAPWCGHCKTAKPHFKEAAEYFKEDTRVAFVAVDCTQNQPVCEQYNVKGFPTMAYFNYGKNQQTYEGGREAKDFIKFMSNPSDPNSMKQDPRDDWLGIQGQEHVYLLGDRDFDQFLQSKKKVLVMFYAPWCGHCTHMKPAYAQAATEITSFVPGAYLAAIDATKAQGVAQRFQLNGFPTLKYFENGQFKFDYSGGRAKENLVEFMRNPSQPFIDQQQAGARVEL